MFIRTRQEAWLAWMEWKDIWTMHYITVGLAIELVLPSIAIRVRAMYNLHEVQGAAYSVALK